MAMLVNMLPYIQIALSVILITIVLLQSSDADLGGTFGGSNGMNSLHTRRGLEKGLFNFTIIIAILFALSAFVGLII